jgi:DNA-binding transcriptional LysR family regulator
VRVAESGGFTAAARRLNLSTAAVSEQVQALENALGVRLLNRTTRQVSLTEIGREYYERCVQILQELDEADRVVSALQLTPRGQLRVYCHQGVSRFVAPLVTGFLARYPEASVDLRTGPVMIDLVQEGFDLAITPSPLPPPDSSLMSRRLAAGRFILCCAPSYLDKHPAPRCPADLAGHNCLSYAYAPFGDHWPFLDAGGNPMVARVSSNLITTSPETLRAAALAGTGVVLLPSFAIFDLLASGGLVPLLPDYQTPEFEIVALYPHRRHVTAKVRAFIEMLVDRFVDEQRQTSHAPIDQGCGSQSASRAC